MSEQLYLVDGWHVTDRTAVYSGRWAMDQKGNEYRQPANLETVTVKLAHNGREYVAWTLAEALDWAQQNTPEVPTREQVEKLKSQWLDDPIWDLYDSEGFEAYRDELKAFQDKQELIWIMRNAEKARQTAERMGIPGNLTLSGYLEGLESRIRKIEERWEHAEAQG